MLRVARVALVQLLLLLLLLLLTGGNAEIQEMRDGNIKRAFQ